MGGCEDPAGGDQTAPAAENFLSGFRAPKYGSDPRVGFHSGNCSANDLQLLSSGALATCRHLCNWKKEKKLKSVAERSEERDSQALVRTHRALAGWGQVEPQVEPQVEL